MDAKRLRNRWQEVKKDRKFGRSFKAGWLHGLLTFTRMMPNAPFVRYMEYVLGEEWYEVLKQYELLDVIEERNLDIPR